VSATRSSALAPLLAAALAACGNHDLETHPFAIQVTRSDQQELPPDQDLYILAGTGRVAAPTVFVLAGVVFTEGDAPVDVEIGFRDEVPGDVVLPAELDGAPVSLLLFANRAGRTGPTGETLPYLGFRLATGTGAEAIHRFLLFEGSYEGAGTATLPITSVEPTAELPFFRVRDDWAEFEPAECGPAYYDWLEVTGDDLFSLRHGERRDVRVGPPEERWTVLHVLSWHRQGTCGNQAEAWTQFAAWR
jgi:hypothetical protein